MRVYLDTSVLVSLLVEDATHLAIAVRRGAALATFDTTMAREVLRLGVAVVAL